MKKIHFLVICIIFLFSCNVESKKIDAISAAVELDTVFFKPYMSEYRGMGARTPFDFYYNGETTVLYYYSILCDSVYIFPAQKSSSKLNSFKLPESPKDSSKVIVLKVISEDSIIVLRKNSLSIVNLQSGKVLFSKIFPTNIAVIANFTLPFFNKSNNKIYCELIEWDALPLPNGGLDTKIIYELSIKTSEENYLPLKYPKERDIGNPNYMFYFNVFNNSIIQSYSTTKKVDIYNIIDGKISHKNLYSLDFDNHTDEKPEIKSLVDRSAEQIVTNTFFSEIFSDDEGKFFYRIQSIPLKNRNKEGLMSTVKDKSFQILKYNKDLELLTNIRPETKGIIPRNFYIKNDIIYCLKHNPHYIVIFKIKTK